MNARREVTSQSFLAIAFLAASGSLSGGAAAAVLTVGQGGEFHTVAEAAQAARDGDIVDITPGVYRHDVAVWLQKRLTLRGRPGQTVLDARGSVAEGKAIWVIRNGDFSIEGIEFRGARAAARHFSRSESV